MKVESYDSIASLLESEEGFRVRIKGRAVASQEGCCVIQDHTAWVQAEIAMTLPIGSWVKIEGIWDGKQIHHTVIQSVSEPASNFPPTNGEWEWGKSRHHDNLRIRHTIIQEIRNFFYRHDFLEVETPAIVKSPGLEPHLDAFELIQSGTVYYLNTSPEYHMKRLLVSGLPRIYQICKSFRYGEKGPLHEPEFTMLEWYRSYADWNDIMYDTEELVAHVARAINKGSTVIPGRNQPVDVRPPWQRLSMADAFQTYAQKDIFRLNEEEFYRTLVEEVEPQLGLHSPVFLTHYPATMASLARIDPDNPQVAKRFEAYVDGTELCNGFDELIDPIEQKNRFQNEIKARRKLKKKLYPMDERFITALQEGMPPSSGNALGLDRLVMLLIGEQRIEEVMAFPASRV